MSLTFFFFRLNLQIVIALALSVCMPFSIYAQTTTKLDKVVIASWGKPISEITNLLVEEEIGRAHV